MRNSTRPLFIFMFLSMILPIFVNAQESDPSITPPPQEDFSNENFMKVGYTRCTYKPSSLIGGVIRSGNNPCRPETLPPNPDGRSLTTCYYGPSDGHTRPPATIISGPGPCIHMPPLLGGPLEPEDRPRTPSPESLINSEKETKSIEDTKTPQNTSV